MSIVARYGRRMARICAHGLNSRAARGRGEEDCLAAGNISPTPSATLSRNWRPRILQAHLGAPENFSYSPVVLHANFSRDHILMHNAAVSGVIDSRDVNWVDKDYDFMYLFLGCGLPFAEQVARRYPDLARLRSKLRCSALVDQIDTIVHGANHALAGQQTAAWKQIEALLKISAVSMQTERS